MSTRKLHITLEQLPTGEYRAIADIPGWSHEHPMRSGDYGEIDEALASLGRAIANYCDGMAIGRRRREREAAAGVQVKALSAGDDADWEWML